MTKIKHLQTRVSESFVIRALIISEDIEVYIIIFFLSFIKHLGNTQLIITVVAVVAREDVFCSKYRCISITSFDI